jgi:hypothetical protein
MKNATPTGGLSEDWVEAVRKKEAREVALQTRRRPDENS